MVDDKTRGTQPGQIGKVSFKDISTLGTPAGKVLAADGQGGTQALSDATGATKLDDLTDVGVAPASAGNVLAGDGAKFDGKTPDAAGLVDKATVQDIAAEKRFTGGIRTNDIDSVSGATISVARRLIIPPALNPGEAATLAQAQAAASGSVVTVGHPDGIRTPDFTNLGNAIDTLTAIGGGIIIILDSDEYEATDIDGDFRDLRNITIIGQPGAEPSHMPFIHLQAALDIVEQSSSSAGFPLPTESTQWHIIGCRISRKGIQLDPDNFGVNFAMLLEECAFTNQDPFGIAVGGNEGAIEAFTSKAQIVFNNCYVESDFRLNTSAWLVLAEDNDVIIRFKGLRPNFTTDTSPAGIQILRTTGAGSREVHHDGTLNPITTGSGISTLNVSPVGLPRPVNLDLHIGFDAAGAVDLDKVQLKLGLDVVCTDAAIGLASTKALPVQTTVDLEADVSVTFNPVGPVPGVATGDALDAASTFYFVYLIADTTGVKAPALLLSTSQPAPTALPTGYDVFRLIGSAQNQASSDLRGAFNKDGQTLYQDGGGVAISTGDPGTSFITVGSASQIPSTAKRVRLAFAADLPSGGTGVSEVSIIHGDIAGVFGQFVLRLQGSLTHITGTAALAEVDLNAAGLFAIRRVGLVLSGVNVFVAGYYESL